MSNSITSEGIASAAVDTSIGRAAGAAFRGARCRDRFAFGTSRSYYATQRRYNYSYIDCMYAKATVPVYGQFVSVGPQGSQCVATKCCRR